MAGFTGAPRLSARALVLDADGRYALLRRTRPGAAPYLVVPGGGVAGGETFAEAAARECAEELGAVVRVGEVVLVAYVDEPAPGSVQRFFLSRLVSIDDAAKDGHEFREPDRGGYETVRVAATDPQLADLRPREIAELIRLRHPYLLREAAALVAGSLRGAERDPADPRARLRR